MKLIDITEGKMKRSDPYISGDSPHPTPRTPAPKKTSWGTKLQNLSKRTGKPTSDLEALYQDIRRELDMKAPGAYGVLDAKVQRSLGLREEREFTDDENGSLTYGWKSREELNDEEGSKRYIPTGYTKILELGGIYANEPGKGQGDALMKQFLSSPEAQNAELIFLDPVPGLGANHGNKDELTQVRRLVAFYKRYGFRHNPKSATKRMWLVKKGELSDTQLPT